MNEPNKINAILKVDITGEFYDNEATEETLRYAVEQDLEDAGFDVDVSVLKEQEHSCSFVVIDERTGKEADTYSIALHEDWAKHLCYCDMDGWAIQDDGSLLLLDECGRYAYADRERFKVKWDE